MHARYFLQRAQVIRQLRGAKEVTGKSSSWRQLDDGGPCGAGDGFPGGEQRLTLLTNGEAEESKLF
jgi:hypothetical protein